MKIISQKFVIHRVLDIYFQIKQKYQGKQIRDEHGFEALTFYKKISKQLLKFGP